MFKFISSLVPASLVIFFSLVGCNSQNVTESEADIQAAQTYKSPDALCNTYFNAKDIEVSENYVKFTRLGKSETFRMSTIEKPRPNDGFTYSCPDVKTKYRGWNNLPNHCIVTLKLAPKKYCACTYASCKPTPPKYE